MRKRMLLRSLAFVTVIFLGVGDSCAAQAFPASSAPSEFDVSSDSPSVDFYSNSLNSDFDSKPYIESTSYIEPKPGIGPNAGRQENNRNRNAPFGLSSEWITHSDSGLVTSKATATIPLLFATRPPPLVKVGFGHTDLFAAEEFGLANDLYEYTIGLSLIRKINQRWTLRTMLGVGFATDNKNTSSDAWQFRGGVFGIYKRSEQLSWTFGALATGRDDLPVIPAVGAVWMPNSALRYDLMFPKPKVNFLIRDNGIRQQWVYLGAGINGNTWGYEQPGFIDDRLTYKDVRVVLGWESRPASSSKLPFALGRTLQAEVGFAFSREFEFENETRVEQLGDSLVAGVSTKF